MRATFVQAPLLALVLLAGSCKEEPPAVAPPPPDVKVAEVLQRDVPVHVELIGETRGNTEIEIRARVEGFIESVDYVEGSLVEKGQLLYTIDARPFEARVAAQKASLAEAQAQLARTRQDVARYEPLVEKNAIPREQYDTAVALEKAAAAVVESQEAMLEQAEIDLSYTRVIAPESGLAGRTEVYVGTLVGRGSSTLLTHISRIDPIHVRFSFPERDYLRFARRHVSDSGGQKPRDTPFELILADGSTHAETGAMVFVDRSVDSQTGTIMAEAAFANPGGLLRPGQYGRVRVLVETREGAILVPQRCVQETQGVYSVLVLAEGDQLEQRLVTPAERMGSLWVIVSGLEAGDEVVVEGLQKVRPGSKVAPQTIAIEESGTPSAPAAQDGAEKTSE